MNPFRYYKMKIDKTNVKASLTKTELDLLLKWGRCPTSGSYSGGLLHLA